MALTYNTLAQVQPFWWTSRLQQTTQFGRAYTAWVSSRSPGL